MGELHKRDILNIYITNELNIDLEDISDNNLELLASAIYDYLNNDSETIRDYI